jgi:hypothetical protein
MQRAQASPRPPTRPAPPPPLRPAQVACKQEQIECLRAALAESPDAAPRQAAAALEEAATLRAQLAKQQLAAQARERRAAQQVAGLEAALARANAQLNAAGALPVAAHDGGCDAAAAADQHALSPPSRLHARALRGDDASEEGPPTPLSPGGLAPPQLPKGSASSWDGSEDPLQPLPGCSPVRVRKGECGGGKERAGGTGECDLPTSPRSDLSGPDGDDGGGEEGHSGPHAGRVPAFAAPGSACASAVFGGRFARDNPLFCCSSVELRRAPRTLAGAEGTDLNASLDEAPLLTSRSAAVLGLAQAQLEIQVRAAGRGLSGGPWQAGAGPPRHLRALTRPAPPLALRARRRCSCTARSSGWGRCSRRRLSRATRRPRRRRACARACVALRASTASSSRRWSTPPATRPSTRRWAWALRPRRTHAPPQRMRHCARPASASIAAGLTWLPPPPPSNAGGARAAGCRGAGPGAYGQVPAGDGRLPRHAPPAAAAAGGGGRGRGLRRGRGRRRRRRRSRRVTPPPPAALRPAPPAPRVSRQPAQQ